MDKSDHITIMGGGMAGLSVAYFAAKRSIPFTLYEAAGRVGGSSVTLRHGEFLFDSGAHRFHDKDPEVTGELLAIMDGEMDMISVPSQIYHRGRFIDFPLSPMNLVKGLGPLTTLKATLELIKARVVRRGGQQGDNESFESFALSTYGRSIAERFLLGYSEKLWGAPGDRLSMAIAGKRMKGLNLKTFVLEAVFGKKAKTEHLDGRFYYPKYGIGMIPEKIAAVSGKENIRVNSPVAGLLHEGGRIRAVQLGDGTRIEAGRVCSTLPLGLLTGMLSPAPPEEIIELTKALRYRSLVLVALFLDKETVTPNASVYFPDPEVPFTRAYEPRNRSRLMSPPGKTSLVLELPCQEGDGRWGMDDEELVGLVASHLKRIGWLKDGELLGTHVLRLPNAYPILELGTAEAARRVFEYLDGFANLSHTGRSGLFRYVHIHDLMRFGKELVDGYARKD